MDGFIAISSGQPDTGIKDNFFNIYIRTRVYGQDNLYTLDKQIDT